MDTGVYLVVLLVGHKDWYFDLFCKHSSSVVGV